MQYVKGIKIKNLLDSIEELHRCELISSNIYRQLNNMAKYKCAKCPNWDDVQCRCQDEIYRKTKLCYSSYKLFEKNIKIYQENKIPSNILIFRKRYKDIMEIREHLIDGFLDICRTIPPYTHEKIIKNIDNFCMKCLYCIAFTDKCTASDKIKKLRNCTKRFNDMQELLSYNKEGNFTL